MKNYTNEIFSALADESRRNILMMLSVESKNVNAIAESFKISRPAVSKHLRILERSKLVTAEWKGRERYFTLNPEPVKQAMNWFKFYEKFWNDKLNSLKQFLEKDNVVDNKRGNK